MTAPGPLEIDAARLRAFVLDDRAVDAPVMDAMVDYLLEDFDRGIAPTFDEKRPEGPVFEAALAYAFQFGVGIAKKVLAEQGPAVVKEG